MYTVTVALKRSYLRSVYSTLGGVTLLAALSAKSIAASGSIDGGQIVRSTSSSDVSVEFAEPGKGALGPQAMVELWESLLNDYDLAVYLLNQNGVASPTDAQIYSKLMSEILISVSSYGGDFSQMRREMTARPNMT